MKRILLLVICLAMCLVPIAYATDVEVSVSLNGSYIQGDAHHLLIDGQVFVVARTLSDALNQDIAWLQEEQKVIISSEDTQIQLTIGSTTAYVNGQATTLTAAPFILKGRTYIPLRMVSQALNFDVAWSPSTYTVELSKENFTVAPENIYTRPYTDEDLLWLSRIVEVESDFDSIPMKLGIANVVINRMKDSRFPNTIYDVIFDAAYSIQFPPAHKTSFQTLEPSYLSILASKKALEGINNVENCLYFNNRPFKSKADDLYIIIESEYFYQ